MTLFLPSFASFKSLKDSDVCTPAESSHAHNAISPELLNTQTPKGFCLSSLLPQMEKYDALLAVFYSSNLLLSLQGVQQPCEDPSVDSSFSSQNSKSSFLFCA
jgi:hypothetical protein